MSGRRSIQFAGLLTVLALVMVFAWACGSGGDETDTTSGGATTTQRPVSTTEAGNMVGTQVEVSDSTPKDFADAIEQGKPVVLLFYVAGGADDVKVLEAVNALVPSFPDVVFLLYDYKSPDAYGDLSTMLEVNYPPELVLIDGTGTVQEVWNGYVDEGTINQGLVNLSGG